MTPVLEARNTGDMILFAQVVEAGTITGGSKRIGLERSTVSRRITSLEDRLGVSLLERSTRKLRLTEIGRQYYKHCLRVVEAAEDAEAVAQRGRVEPAGVLTIGASLCEADKFLADTIAEFVDRYERILVELDTDVSDPTAAIEQSDVFLHIGEPSDLDTSGARVGQINEYLWASPDYLSKHAVGSEPESLQQAACICRIDAADKVLWSMQSQDTQVNLTIVPRFRVRSLASCRDACISGLGVAKLPEYLCREAERRGELTRIYSEWRMTGEHLYALRGDKQLLTRKGKAFIDFLRERMALSHP